MDAESIISEKHMLNFMKLIGKYERHLADRPGIDPQAVYAYTNMLRTALDLSKRLPHRKPSPEEMTRRAKEILEMEYGVKR